MNYIQHDFSFFFNLQLCLFPLVAIVFLLNTSSFNVSTSWDNQHPALTRKDTKVDTAQYHNKRWRLYSEATWSSVEGKCLNVSLHTHHLRPGQVDSEFIEQTVCVITLMLMEQTTYEPTLSLSNSALSPHFPHCKVTKKSKRKEISAYIVINNIINIRLSVYSVYYKQQLNIKKCAFSLTDNLYFNILNSLKTT